MKRFLILLLALASQTICYAQYDAAIRYRATSPTFYTAIDTLIARAAVDATDTSEGGPLNGWTRWRYYMGSRVSNDVAIGDDVAAPMDAAMTYYMVHHSDYCPGAGYTGNWKCLGPFTGYYGQTEQQGRINSIWVHPSDTGHILIGADGGGLWKTNDGGRKWRNITDGAGFVPSL